jgi:hypothetical protein
MALETFVSTRQPDDFRLKPLSGTGTDNFVTPRPRSPQLFGDAVALAAAHQDFVFDEAFKLADCLLEVPLLTFFHLPLIHEHGFVNRIIEQLRID